MNEDRATRYQRQRRNASVGGAVFTGAVLFIVVLSGGGAFLRDAATSLAGGSRAVAAALVVLILTMVIGLATLPFAYFHGVTLERRYGLAAQSIGRWWMDHAKAAVLTGLGLVCGGVLVAKLLEWTPQYWWMIAAGVAAAMMLGLAFIAPVLLVPIFSGSTPLRREDLVARLMHLAARADTRVLGVFEWHLGSRTKKANAALTGLGRTRRILVSDTLLAEHSDDEIEVILAHELAHHVYHDLWSGLLVQGAVTAVALYVTDLALTSAVGILPGVGGKTDLAVLPLLALTAGAVLLLFTPLTNAISRAHERRADRYALEMTGNAPAFLSAMKRLGARNLSDDRPSPIIEYLFYTHPPVGARILAAQAWAAGRDPA